MTIRVLAACAATVAYAFAVSAPAMAAAQVDQSQYQFDIGIPWGFDLGGGNVLPNTGVGQSYTAGMAGTLDSINLYCNGICSIDQAGNTLTLSLFQGATLLKTVQTFTTNGTFDTTNLVGFSYIGFSFAGMNVAQLVGESYRFTLDSITGPGDIGTRGGLGKFGNPYPGGVGNAGVLYGDSFPDFDMTFNTLVEPGVAAVPEPASWAMLIAGFGLVGAAMRRRVLKAA